MSEENYSDLIDRYDQAMELLANLRIIASGGAALIEDSCSAISRMLQKNNSPELRARFNDACSALIWLRDELVAFPMEEDLPDIPSDSASIPISL